jgi:hypothetical protein
MLVVVNVTIPYCFPHVPHLEPYPHHRDPLDVAGLGESRSPNAGTDVPDKAAISVDPGVSASAPVWAAAAVGGTTTARASARSAAGASAPVWAAATTPLGVRSCPLRLLSRCLPRQLELIVGATVG